MMQKAKQAQLNYQQQQQQQQQQMIAKRPLNKPHFGSFSKRKDFTCY
jgi:hypothetical protein